MNTEKNFKTDITVKKILSELINRDSSFAKVVLPFAIDKARASLMDLANAESEESFVVRIEGTRLGIVRTYIPGERYERLPVSTVEFKRNCFKNDGKFKKVERLSRLFNLPKNVVKALDKNFDYCQIMFLIAERIKNGKMSVSIINLDRHPEAIVNTLNWLNLQHFGVEDATLKQFKTHIIKNHRENAKNLKTLAQYFIWIATGNDASTYITKDDDDRAKEEYDAGVKEAKLAKAAKENAETYCMSVNLARALETSHQCGLFRCLAGRRYFSTDTPELRNLRAALTSPDFEEQKNALCSALTMVAEADKYLNVETINCILDVIKNLASTSRDDIAIAKEMATAILG